jgi:hypothetical protein
MRKSEIGQTLPYAVAAAHKSSAAIHPSMASSQIAQYL